MKILLILISIFVSLFAKSDLEKDITLQLLWTHQFEFAGFYMAKEKGYYKEAGFNVDISDGFLKNTIEDVNSGKIDFGVAGSKVVYEAIKGKKLIALASIFQTSPFVWLTRKDSNIKTLHDFVGKTVMHAEHSLDNIELLAILKARGVDTSKVNLIPHTYNIHDLINKKSDVTSAYISNEPYELEKEGIEYRLFKPIEYGVDFYGDILFTTEKYLDKNPKVVKSFREASLKGWKYAFENIEETIHIIHTKYNKSLSLGHLRYEANILKKQSLYPFVAVGTMDKERWESIAQTFKDLGYLKSSILPKSFIYNENKNKQRDLIFKWVLIVVVSIGLISLILMFLVRKHNSYMQALVTEKTNSLESEKQNYEAFFTQAVYGILIIQDGRFVKVNDLVLEMLNYETTDEVINLRPEELSPEYQPDGELSETKAAKLIGECLEKGFNKFEWLHTKNGGETFWCEVYLSLTLYDGIESIQVTWRDISRQKSLEEDLERKVFERTEELEIAMRAKSDFLANMSHEIRTPLNAIIGFVDILFKSESDTDKQQKLKIIKDSGYSLVTIINDILDFSKIENNKLMIEKIPYDISETFHSVVELFFSKAKESEVILELGIDEKLPKYTQGDPVRVKQVLSNLLSNAIKFTGKGKRIKVKVKYLDASNELYCEVKDQGIGIQSSQLNSIFESFVQENSTTTRKFGGTGLGLSISKALVELMDGEIGLISKVAEGSTFYFKLPLYEVDEDSIDIDEVRKEDLDDMSGHILLVEDNKSNQMLMSLLLEELGLDSEIANDGLEAIAAMENENSYDLILMDENMPNMNGIEATKKIREMSRCKNIPIIAVTANALKGDKEKFLAAGMSDYISKPIDAQKLENILRKYL
ncbi:ABC transporter substrate-binding protein [Sulfurimonas sp.]|nr:ABC transporter substrate-binding protein [Sulfurimonas sp.]